MPLTPKGKKIMKAMRKQYGKKEGESVFYASKNKGTIKGVDEDMDINEGEVKRKNKKLKKAVMPKREEDYYEGGAHSSAGKDFGGYDRGKKQKGGKKKDVPGLLNRNYTHSGPRTRKDRAKKMLKRHTSGPKQKLPDHTVYHDMGYLMAESLGLVSEASSKADLVQRGKDAGAPSTPFKRSVKNDDSVERARAAYKAKVARQSQNMIGADEEPSEAKKSRAARKRGGTEARVKAAKGVKYQLGTRGPSRRGTTTVKIKPSTKKKMMEKPKAPKYK